MQNLLDDLTKLLQKDNRFTAEGKLLKNKVIEAALQFDPKLLKLLLSHKPIKKHFFQEVEGINIFDKTKFQKFISNKSFLPDSYTSYKNKIGLTADEEFISERKEVVLSWPYKDCVLEGGQTKEDEKRNEIFWNEILAPDEIDRLLSPKILTNFKKCDSKGEHKVTEISLEDNLIIKGNNLLALHSLLPVYRGRIKLIYIDPPFNTGNDEFKYNDKFNHSTWLTFMNNRLQISRDLLSIDGFIVVNIGNEEINYLNVLMDQIYGEENFINMITMTTNDPSGFKATSSKIFSTANYLLIYQKSSASELNKIFIAKDYDTAYKYVLLNKDEDYHNWIWKNIGDCAAEKEGFKNSKQAIKQIGKIYLSSLIQNFAFENRNLVFRTAAISGGAREKRIKTIKKSWENRNKVFVHPNEDIANFYILNSEQILFYADRFKEIDGMLVPAETITDVWTDISWTGISPEGGVSFKNGKKPERLIQRIIELTTRPTDSIIDYHLGSGTTCAVAHKLDRKYIGIEQIDYLENDGLTRINNVINGDTTGISKSINWKGGGSFICCELAELNQQFINRITSAKTTKELKQIWETIKKDGFISYKVNPKEIDNSISEFEQLSLQNQKKFLIEILDKNHLYVNYSEIEDKDYKISEEDKKLNKKFYSLK